MKFEVYSVFDAAAQAFYPPIFLATEQLLIREMLKVRDKHPEHLFVKHSEQFTVFRLGTFDDSTGQLMDLGQEAVINLKVLFSRGGRPVAVDSVQTEGAA